MLDNGEPSEHIQIFGQLNAEKDIKMNFVVCFKSQVPWSYTYTCIWDSSLFLEPPASSIWKSSEKPLYYFNLSICKHFHFNLSAFELVTFQNSKNHFCPFVSWFYVCFDMCTMFEWNLWSPWKYCGWNIDPRYKMSFETVHLHIWARLVKANIPG